MADNPNRPKAYDVVLGGQVPIPSRVAVLGGLEGVKRQLTSAVVKQQISALSEALKYGQKGLAGLRHFLAPKGAENSAG